MRTRGWIAVGVAALSLWCAETASAASIVGTQVSLQLELDPGLELDYYAAGVASDTGTIDLGTATVMDVGVEYIPGVIREPFDDGVVFQLNLTSGATDDMANLTVFLSGFYDVQAGFLVDLDLSDWVGGGAITAFTVQSAGFLTGTVAVAGFDATSVQVRADADASGRFVAAGGQSVRFQITKSDGVPEPSSLALIGVAALAGLRRRLA